jgi:hypothetical protein
MRKPLVLAAVVVGVAAIVRKRSNAKSADAALWHEATSGGSANGARTGGSSANTSH